MKVIILFLCLCLVLVASGACVGDPGTATVKVSSKPSNSGKINPFIYGSFIELLDDVVPGMWAEMLNDRGFEGVFKPAGWCYYTGDPNVCDKEWTGTGDRSYDTDKPFNGTRSVKLTVASISQSDLYVKKSGKYVFSGYFRASSPDVRATVKLKTLLPNGKWMVLASAKLPKQQNGWAKFTAPLISAGTTDRAVFELDVKGTGTLWADKLSLMPTDTINGWRKDAIRVIKEANSGMIRWGGSVVDPGGYKWKNGIGERDARVPFENCPWGRIDSNDVGLDEFLAFCEATCDAPLICVSFSDGPESAKEMVEYCNGKVSTEWGKKRAENGHPKPYNVRYWQLGNELGDENYAKGCQAICQAIREADPNAIILSSFPSDEVIQEVGSYVDYLCPHHYTSDIEGCEADIKGIVARMQKMHPGKPFKIGVTEWNITGGEWGLGRGKLMTLGCALSNARYLNMLHRHADVVGLANRSNMTNSCGSGMIQTSESGIYMTPSYYVMKLYADHTKPIPIEVSGAFEKLDVSACRSEDSKLATIFVVNPTDVPLTLNLDLSELSGFKSIGGEIVCDTLNMGQPDLQNHWKAPDRVRIVKLPLQKETIEVPALSVMALEYEKE